MPTASIYGNVFYNVGSTESYGAAEVPLFSATAELWSAGDGACGCPGGETYYDEKGYPSALIAWDADGDGLLSFLDSSGDSLANEDCNDGDVSAGAFDEHISVDDFESLLLRHFMGEDSMVPGRRYCIDRNDIYTHPSL